MFSGQGSQKIGMGLNLAENFKSASEVFQCASEILHTDILKICTEENSSKLFQTQFAQPAIAAVSIAAFKTLQNFNVPFQAVVGHSLGSISALMAAQVISIEDGFKIIDARAKAMQKCENNNNGTMCAIIGADKTVIKNACQNASDYVICANFNGTNQIVISGTKTAVEEVTKQLKTKAKRCIMLNVKAAFHSKLMKPAAEIFSSALESITFHKPKVTVFSNVTGKKIDDTTNIKELLIKQIYSPVKFTQNLIELEKLNFINYVEFGPSKTLCSIVKSTIKNAVTLNVFDKISLMATTQQLNL